MRGIITLLIVVLAINVLLAAWTPWRIELVLICLAAGAGAAAAAFGTRFIARAIFRRRVHSHVAPWMPRGLAPILVAAFCLAAAGAFFALPLVVDSVALIEATYYSLIVAFGISLAWTRKGPPVAVLTLIAATLCRSSIQIFRFLSDPDAQHEFGPEIWVFATGGHVVIMALLAVDVGVCLAAWQMAAAVRGVSSPTPPVPQTAIHE